MKNDCQVSILPFSVIMDVFRYILAVHRAQLEAYSTVETIIIRSDDNARPHRARLVENMLEAETIQRMEWPACSLTGIQPSMFGTYLDDALLRDQGHLLLSET
ncbi:hypothetical protein TNCV_1317601 [Trichonephila clavipes]|nr:hypothetical protein TNCV_1317601 [Trichonephila clavipes]